MRLKNIKLAGFKSFVDPTTVVFPSNLSAVLGPNGCGKSNIIDAVRWVMGESSAKQLRGGSMADVIFNGSTHRQPAGHASIELTFSGCEGHISGEYAKYDEISIRREVSRDGSSDYYLNNTRCRRRDITDIFLGTGLGPRSYAIIKQDTTAKIVDSKPEEFRVHLEEAAGISKYKERRKETLNRIKHTRENLERLNDIREELGKQLIKLERQAAAAEKYKILKGEEFSYKTQLIALQWRDCEQQMESFREKLESTETHNQSLIAKVRELEAELEESRVGQAEKNEEFQLVQSDFYQLGNEITRTEQQLLNSEQRLEQLQSELEQVSEDFTTLEALQTSDSESERQIREELETVTPLASEYKENATLNDERLSEAEVALQDWQERWEQFSQAKAQATQSAQVEQTRLQQIEQRQRDADKRINQLKDEQSRFDLASVEEQICESQQAHLEASALLEEYENQMASSQSDMQTLREAIRELDITYKDKQTVLQQSKGRLASLEALQQAALEIKDNAVAALIERNQLTDAKRLAELIEVEEGFTHAVEVVLGDNLQALCIDSFDALANEVEQLSQGELNCIRLSPSEVSSSTNSSYPSLASKVKGPKAVTALLADIYCVDNLAQARRALDELGPEAQVITADGLWLSHTWMRLARKDVSDDSVIRRQQELTQLGEQVEQLTQKCAQLEEALFAKREELNALEQNKESTQQAINEQTKQISACESQLKIKEARATQMRTRLAQINREIEELAESQALALEEYESARSIWEDALSQLETHDSETDSLTSEGQSLRERLMSVRQEQQHTSDLAHEYEVKLETLRSQLQVTAQNTERQKHQLETYRERKVVLERSIAENDTPIEEHKAVLAELVEKRVESESKVQEARQALEAFSQKVRELESSRHNQDGGIEQVRQELEQLRLKRHEYQVRQQTLDEQMAEYEITVETVFETMPEDADLKVWESEISRIQSRISRLGAINLAAIEEFDELKERKVHLDSQNEDLESALTTLEDAIEKIDAETRNKFKETFDHVNRDFKMLFPKVFGGGSAELELTDDDLLEAGVLIKARPPGKKNASVHMLSGGEKAMTAIALVFAIFQLNPAPFCMLDEVDAPLDDANVMRFSNLVKEMADKVQFIFITHNKVTMEMANHLLGVTMHEPGVSRIVSVDVEDAMALAEVG